MMFIDMNVLMQAEGVIGSFRLSVLMLWTLALIEYAIRKRSGWTGLLGAGIFVVLISFGIVNLYPNLPDTGSVRVAYTTGPYGGDYLSYTAVPEEECIALMERSVREAAEQGAEILVFTEEAFEINNGEEDAFLERCCEAAKENGINVLVGLDVKDENGGTGRKNRNLIALIDPDGEILSTYLKTKLIPVIEADYIRGNGDIPSHVIKAGGREIKVSYLICYDSNFPEYVKQIDNDTDILFLPSWDWAAIKGIHLKMCCAIAAENRVCILKPTYDGYSIAVNPDGKIIHITDTDVTGYEKVHIVDIPLREGGTAAAERNSLQEDAKSIVPVEIMSILMCMIILYANLFENSEKTARNTAYSVLVGTCILALGADALSWIIDGCVRLETLSYVITFLSMVLSFVMATQFVAYMTEFVRERQPMNNRFLYANIAFCIGAVIMVVIGTVDGNLFTIANGTYSDGPRYGVYVAVNVCNMVFCIVMEIVYRKALTGHDRVATFLYPCFPAIAAAINLYFPQFSYAYPTTTLSLSVIYVMLQSERVGKLVEKEQTSSERAVHDDLTGLQNRRAFEEKQRTLLSIDGTAGVIYADINGLKYANDHYGHAAGDQLLICFAELLSLNFRKDEVFRISGDEFAVVIPEISRDDFEERVASFQSTLLINGKEIASIGADFGTCFEVKRLLKSAEERMYKNKEAYHAAHQEIVRV